MANALASFMLGKLDTVILEYLQQEVSLVVGAEEEVKKLTTTFKVIQAVLNDAEQRQIKDEAVKLWLEEFKDIVYEMDDLLDEWSFEMHKSQTDTAVDNMEKVISCSSSYSLCSLFSCFGKVVLLHNIGTKIKYIRERLDMAEIEKQKYRLIETRSDEKPIERLKSSSLIDVSDILGRVTDKETILSKLVFLGESSTSASPNQPSSSTQALHAPNIISIVGMGGLGKTTLAQLVFNDDQVNVHFEKTMWVCVSDPFDLVTVTKAIIEEAKCKVPKSSEWNTLHHCLSDSIKDKRFLLVLDDVWTEDRSIWEPLEVSFRYGAKGSCILVTTRNERVSLMMNATYTHSLGVLSDDDCSSLLSRIALAGRNEENHEDLREIGQKISKKCKGLPLAAKTLGGLLHFKNKNEWLSILESEIWKLEEVENGFLKPALLLSYYYLPLPLKGCFVYCSIFPKDHKIEKDFLVKLWMAQGFLKSTSENKKLEMIGDDYFNNLAMRSFFQDFERDSTNGNIIYCKMHDLVHDFAQFLTQNESLAQNTGTPLLNSSSRVRHLTLVCEDKTKTRDMKDSYDYLTSLIQQAKKLRTLHIWNKRGLITIQEISVDLLNHLKCLKVLSLQSIGLENLSSEIGNLLHLRYLDLSYNTKLKIPETISSLYNLETLKLVGCNCLCRLPKEMWRMIKLRHLDIRKMTKLSHMPQGMGRLTSLITLSDFIIGDRSEEGCKISELKDLHLLQGDLSITGLGRVETVNEAFQMDLKQNNLHTLVLGFNSNEETIKYKRGNLFFPLQSCVMLNEGMSEDVLEVLKPHPDLVELEVSDYLGFKLSKWIESTSYLCHLRILKLYNCTNLTKLQGFGQLPSLEVLDVKRAIKVKHIGLEFYTNNVEHVNKVAFPKLKELHMDRMYNLEVWELQHGVVMPCVRFISLICPKLKALPALGKLPSLKELIIDDADKLMHIGPEFLYEVDEAGGERFNHIAFPKLESLTMKIKKLEWEFGVIASTGVEIMPCLREVNFNGCMNLQLLIEALSKMPFLNTVEISGEATEFINYLAHDDDDNDDVSKILFANVENLVLRSMNMKKLKLGSKVMPSLISLSISDCQKLKALQGLSKLKTLELSGCPSLYELPLPNLKHLKLSGETNPSLPQAFATTLTGLQHLTILDSSKCMMCVPEQVQQLTSLQTLRITSSDKELKLRCSKDGGEYWRIISHIPNIRIMSLSS